MIIKIFIMSTMMKKRVLEDTQQELTTHRTSDLSKETHILLMPLVEVVIMKENCIIIERVDVYIYTSIRTKW